MKLSLPPIGPGARRTRDRQRMPRWGALPVLAACLVVALAVPTLAQTTSVALHAGDSVTVTCDGTKLAWDRTSDKAGKLTCRGTVSSTTTTAPPTTTTTVPPTTTTTTAPPPSPTPPPSTSTSGLWISRSELMALPTSGSAWNAVVSAANGSWGSADLADNNSDHDMMVLAGALVAARTDNAAMRSKVISGINSLRNSGFARVLEMSRNVPGYVIAADVIDLKNADPSTDQWFRGFIAGLRTKPLDGHSGGDNLRETAMFSANNWGGRSRAAMVAIDLYLGDTADIADIVTAQRGYLGEAVADRLSFTSTNWHANPSNKAGINRRGATISGRNVDGVIPEDQRRTGEFSWPAPAGNYPWGALQGESMASAMLHRAGLMSFRAGDDAIVRATSWLYNVNNNPASGDDTATPWIINKYAGTSFPTTAAAIGKSIAWTDWTHR